jgi:hypothetical protein
MTNSVCDFDIGIEASWNCGPIGNQKMQVI